MPTPEEIIEESLNIPKRGVNNMGTFEESSIPDKIKGAQFLAGQNAMTQRSLGLVVRAFNMPGTI